MLMKLRSKRFGGVVTLGRSLFAFALLVSAMAPSLALAQSSSDPWTEPVNISRSGTALNPSFVMDSEGIGHALWQDENANFVYSQFDGEQWSTPKTTALDRLFDVPLTPASPVYAGPNPWLVAGPGKTIFAFWLSARGNLLRSKLKNESFGNPASWETGRVISADVAAFTVAIDPLGDLHLVYIRTIEDPSHPAGVYYTRSANNGVNWSAPLLLYASPYFRTLVDSGANVSVATMLVEDALHVYVAWDNLPRKQIFLAQSSDGGKTWAEPALVAGPSPEAGAAGPFNIRVGSHQDSLVLIWQNGRATNGLLPACNQVYQYSDDAGATWSEPQPMMEDISGCAQSNEYVTGFSDDPDIPLYLLTKTKGDVYLSAWNGSQWSQPQEQRVLSAFEDPEIFTEVVLGCHRASLFNKRLYIVGCDTGEGGDAWFTSRDIGSFQPPVWSQLAPVMNDARRLEALDLVSTEDGLFHAFFTQYLDPAVYYTYWDGEVWSRTAAILESPEGEAAWPAVAVGPGNELFLIARNNTGTLYFSRATSGNAGTESRWSTPVRVETGQNGEIGSADVAWGANGTIYVVYSVPVNEKRGIYVIQSPDKGATWSEPLQVFDGVAAGFDLVGVPSLLVTDQGEIHIIWKQQAIEGDGGSQSLSLFHTRSQDGGQTFSQPQLAVDEAMDWREIMIDGNGNLHLLWQPQDTLTVWDQVSQDGGQTWGYPQGLPNEGRPSAVTQDATGNLHLFGVGLSALGHWIWDGNSWQAEKPLAWTPSSQQDNPVELLAAAVSAQGKLMAVMAKQADHSNAAETNLFYSTRTLEASPTQNSGQKAATPTSLPPTLVIATSTADAPTATPDSGPTALPVATQTVQSDGQSSPFQIALLPVGLLLLSVLVLVVWRAARTKDR